MWTMIQGGIFAVSIAFSVASSAADRVIPGDGDGSAWGTRVKNVADFIQHEVDPYDVEPILTKSMEGAIARLETVSYFEVSRADAKLLRAAASDKTLRDGRFFVVRAVDIAAFARHRVFLYDNKILVAQAVMGAPGKPRKSAILVRLETAPDEVFVTWSAAY